MKNEIEMNPDVLSENNIPTESVKPKTNVVFFLNSGGQFGIGVPFSPEEFIKVYKNACLTELEPEEYDENGVGRILTCVGFAPLPDDIAHKISKKFQLYK